jgi:hypothetical protein
MTRSMLSIAVRRSDDVPSTETLMFPEPYKELAALRHAQFVLLRYVPALSPVDVAPARHALDDAIDSIELQFLERRGAEGQRAALTREIAEQRSELWTDFLRPIIRVARERFGDVPEVRDVPRGCRRARLGGFLQHVYIVADIVTAYEEAFVRTGVPLDTGAKLRRMAHELAALAARRDGLERVLVDRRTATDVSIQHGRDAVAALGPVVAAQFRGRAVVLAAWRRGANLRGGAERVRSGASTRARVVYEPCDPRTGVTLPLARGAR